MLHAHSGFRWLVLLFLVLAIIKSVLGWLRNKEFKKSDNLIAILLVSFTHVQAIIGIGLYFIKGWSSALSNMGLAMKEAPTRFWSIEHMVIMILAVVLITIGRSKSKKATTGVLKHKKGAIFYIIALILILWAGVIKPLALGKGWI